LIDFGDACTFDLKNPTHKKLLEIFQKYVTAVNSINPGWKDFRKDFESEIDAVQTGEPDFLLLGVFKGKLKDTMTKHESVLYNTASLLAGPLRKVLSSTVASTVFNSALPFYNSVCTIDKFMKGHKDIDDFQFTQVAINLFDKDFDRVKLNTLIRNWQPRKHSQHTGGRRGSARQNEVD